MGARSAATLAKSGAQTSSHSEAFSSERDGSPWSPVCVVQYVAAAVAGTATAIAATTPTSLRRRLARAARDVRTVSRARSTDTSRSAASSTGGRLAVSRAVRSSVIGVLLARVVSPEECSLDDRV